MIYLIENNITKILSKKVIMIIVENKILNFNRNGYCDKCTLIGGIRYYFCNFASVF